MSMIVVCPNCRARLRVSEKLAGLHKPCPKCKELIAIPTEVEEIIIHEPEPDGHPGAGSPKKLAVVRPLPRLEPKVQATLVAGVMGVVVLAFVLALLLRGNEWRLSVAVLALGAVALAPVLVWAGYILLENQELEPYRGRELAARAAICAAIYALLWLVVWGLKRWVFPTDAEVEHWNTLFLLAPPLAIGTTTAWATLDLDPGSGFFHYCLYFGVCVLLRLTMGLTAL